MHSYDVMTPKAGRSCLSEASAVMFAQMAEAGKKHDQLITALHHISLNAIMVTQRQYQLEFPILNCPMETGFQEDLRRGKRR